MKPIRPLTIVSVLIFGLSLTAWGTCGPGNSVTLFPGGCDPTASNIGTNGYCNNVEAYTNGDGSPCDSTDTTSCTPTQESIIGDTYVNPTAPCTSDSDCTVLLTFQSDSAYGGAISGGSGTCGG